jgi:hypothetical protein
MKKLKGQCWLDDIMMSPPPVRQSRRQGSQIAELARAASHSRWGDGH